ncbi:MAG: right-handed parallel beta-helix repeat-containing protein [Deltaproteobacteria bacterium]|nr:right-handed parallel beta-helix repeat-containing protein [Deltaproteobacteria bacterium]
MWRGVKGALACWALSACVAPETAPLPDTTAESWLVASFEGEVLHHLFAAGNGELSARGWAGTEGETLVLLPLPWSLEALQLASGPVTIPDPQAVARELPQEIPIFLLEDAGWAEPEDGRPWRTRIRLPRFLPSECAAVGGCLATAWPHCQLDCPAVVVAPPAPPLAANLPTITRPECERGATGLLSGRCVDFQAACAEAWPPDLVNQPEVIFADATAAPPGLGTASVPYADLSAAIASAPEGGIVALRGAFAGNLVLRDRRLTLRGLCPNRSRLTTRTGTTVLLQGGMIGLEGLSVLGPRALGVDGGQHRGAHLYLEAETGLHVAAGEIETSTVVVRSTGTSVRVRSGTWRGGEVELLVEGGDGVRVASGATAELEALRIVASAGAQSPIVVTGGLELSDSIVEGPFADSTLIDLGGRLSIRNVRLLASGSHGLLVDQGSTLELDTVEIANAGVHGLLVRDSAFMGMDLWVHDIVGTADGFGQAVVLNHNQAQLLERVRIENVIEGILIDPPAKPETGPVTLRDVEISDCKTYGMTLQGGVGWTSPSTTCWSGPESATLASMVCGCGASRSRS